jgi:HK97 family phage major capsid protein
MLRPIPDSESELRSQIDALAHAETLTSDEERHFDTLLRTFDERRRTTHVADIRATDPFDVDLRTASKTVLRDKALQVLEGEARSLAPFQLDHVDTLLRSRGGDVDGSEIAKRILLTENDRYRSAFMKAVTQTTPAFSPDEARAIDEYRAGPMADGTNSLGGFGIPVFIDPSIILTSGAADSPILRISRIVQTTTNQWKGVSSAGVSWSFDAEGSAVSDDSPTLAQPTIPVYTARGFVPFTYEVGQDYPDFAAEMQLVLDQGYMDLMASQTAVGSGSSQPTGVFIAMQNTTTNPAHVTLTTAGTIGAVDLRAAYGALPERYRSRATWVMSQTVVNKVLALGNNNALSDFSVNLTADGVPQLLGRPVVVTDYAPAFSGVTTAYNYAVVGDFSNFVVASRAGMSIELVQNLFDQSTGRPNATRGWLAWSRLGHNVVAANGFRLLSNT